MSKKTTAASIGGSDGRRGVGFGTSCSLFVSPCLAHNLDARSGVDDGIQGEDGPDGKKVQAKLESRPAGGDGAPEAGITVSGPFFRREDEKGNKCQCKGEPETQEEIVAF